MDSLAGNQPLFKNTEVSNVVYEPYKSKKYRSIEEVDFNNCKLIPVFSEAATNKAMMKLGYQPQDLVQLSGESIDRIPGSEDIRRRIINEMEERRKNAFQKIIEERKNILAQENPPPKPSAQRLGKDYGEIIKEQQRQINVLKRTKEEHISKKNNQLKKIEESDKDAAKRIKEYRKQRNQELAERRAKQEKREKEVYEKLTQEIMQQKLAAEIQRQKFEEEAEMREQNNSLRRLKPKPWKDSLSDNSSVNSKLLQNREKIENEAREKAKQIIEKQNHAIQIAQKRKLDKMKEISTRIKEQDARLAQKQQMLEEKERESVISLINSINNKISKSENILQEQRRSMRKMLKEKHLLLEKKSEEVSQRRQRLELERLSKLNDAINHTDSVADKKRAISELRLSNYQKMNEQLREKAQSVLSQKQKIEEETKAHMSESIEKQNNAIKRSEELQKKRNEELKKRAAVDWEKRKLGSEKARMINLQRQYARQEKAEKTEQRMNQLYEERMERKEQHEIAIEKIKMMRMKMMEEVPDDTKE
ncbi:hypothetical protein TVAG_457070 [Trichomonas vaginalis G3]|uniref:Uncharacterized protein n=1 Tax=Trichomonas vaginalis (strain ATCC PRA-98 / G3) TaxID=412133 RepID=A2DC31_TRIV3|nr:hypothetical protein TVAGG3_0263550 [Trichomonas vaginalis G3]EAY22072.1 hypothetical protein TVAG_457070 [Trichomonas vaginalis G3]KAI5525299.1 hypothetical protein TVAGG3_0263550 [Trichomonas vaginalis G3]|eukprot:XP_001583058.1 hypothetical protein [Trichomonas vaginalis G3]